ncbi:hypothetical protein PI86_11945 [Burkholderia sp. A9]|uniref:polysaccharide pyruvyl transferase family protein n=1 Tax=Burkholderia sp. A9 TaxID=1365108 RepID=UPI000574D06E|nr:polysaccharide pyruvyl transferase family protein [Burkholderia sp. A9]KHK57093.1 hypothetical protein PI86_11945 [Burkholderia sp. A9]
MKTPDVYLLHAYSSRNSGDGLLVKLSLKAIRDAGIVGIVTVVCLDPRSFRDYLDDAAIRIWSWKHFLIDSVQRAGTSRATIFFGVGGGYLRASYGSEGWKSLLAHGSQLLCTALYRRSISIYLPQSVGPFESLAGKLLARLVRRNVDLIFLRDDKSPAELGHPNSERIGDLVVLEIGESKRSMDAAPEQFGGNRPICFVFRDLKGKDYRGKYLANIRRLVELLPDAKFALQSSGRGNGDDVFYREQFGIGEATQLKDAIEHLRPLVISVRLHGSLESILAGVPSVHIAYERKGKSAFADLGLSRFVFHASDFDPDRVAALARQLAETDTEYWRHMEQADVGRYKEMTGRIRREVEKFNHVHYGR